MSLTLIVVVASVMAALIGIKIYIEYKEEQKLEDYKKQSENETFATIVNSTQFSQEESLVSQQPVETKPVIDVKTETAEEKPKKKKRRYYGKPKAKKNATK
jgi:hypothetical protein